MSEKYDLTIIGGGPGGLTAAIYASREGIETLLLEKEICGGQPANADVVENYPGFPDGIKGSELIEKFKKQAQRFGTEILEFQNVESVKQAGENIEVITDDNKFISKTVVAASGSVPSKLNIPGEEEYSGRGVSYCATCDGPLYKGGDVAVIGCGSSGLQEGGALLKYVNSVKFIEYLPYMTGEQILQDRLQENEKSNFLLNHEVIAINGNDEVTSLTVRNRENDEEKQIDVSGVFIYAGLLPNSDFLEGVVDLNDDGYVITNEKMETSVPGIYAVGDVRADKVRQIDVATGEATTAAITVREYLKEEDRK